MNKIIPFRLFFFFISGTFATTFNSVSASELIANSWNTKTPMNKPRAGLGVVAVDDKIYAIGGDNFGTNERYDTKTNTWTTLKSMPTPRANFAIVAYQGKIYCISSTLYDPDPQPFGVGEAGTKPMPVSSSAYIIGINEVYDTVTNSWGAKTPPPVGIPDLQRGPVGGNNLQAQVVDGKIFVIAGLTLYMYDPVTDVWIEKSNIPVDMMSAYNLALTGTDDELIVIGAFRLSISGTYRSTTEGKVLAYDLKTDLWTEVNSAPMNLIYVAAVGVTTGFYAPQKIYSFEERRTAVYDPVANTWSTAEHMSTARRDFGVAVVDDVIYVIGGSTTNFIYTDDGLPVPRQVVSSVNEQYVPLGYGSALPSDPFPSDSDGNSFSDSSETFWDFLTVSVIAIIVLTAGIVVTATASFFYLKKKKNRCSESRIATP
ncbi:MAG: hypothetical protein LBH74_09020 [Nitrososphaerota archaeon]|jgi:hypothetical protein|nr:hypothetical protein [Nitrososphaerota archaeon]